MNRRHALGAAAVLLAIVLLAGCASPHYLQLNPQRSVPVPQAGSGQAVTVAAVDEREDDVVGTRSGSAMSTAVITVSAHELVPNLQREAERAVRDMGFSPTTQPGSGQPSLTLTLKHLGYERGDSQPVIDEARLEAVLEVKVTNQGTTYTGTYTSRRTQSYALRPSRDANRRMLNDLIAAALDRAFSDPELARLLAR
ncbi:hypothetical protein HNO52_14395 [Billgrantia diversa]|uniref:YajG family lipoprotein n=1 Tax=Halomonas sp. MCCC 1A13316 TaxID=2733487 RepID=UPI0018A47E08|nr:YajG family lipoprotein [Halomonas sp. MCCC 1A13316]QOR39571.1 hypothetical protein HNO52_14395 [Halomonas sp. MCCC 1A13316]